MKKIIALLLAILCTFTFIACGEDDSGSNNPPLTDYEKVVKYIQDNGGYVTFEEETYGTITISNPGNIIRIKQVPDYSDPICAETTLDLKENEDFYNYEAYYINDGDIDFYIEGKIEASTHDYDTPLTYTYKSPGSGTVLTSSLRVVNLIMLNTLQKVKSKIWVGCEVDIYELFNFDKLVY